MNTGLREEVKLTVNALLAPYLKGLTVDKLLHEYLLEYKHHLPYKQLGYNSPLEFLASIPDVVKFIRYASGHILLKAVTNSKNSIMQEFVKGQKNSQASKNFRRVNNNHYELPFRQNPPPPYHYQSSQLSVPPPRINSNSNMAAQFDKPFSFQVVQSEANTLKPELQSSSTYSSVEYEEQLVSEFKQILQYHPDGVAIAHVFALYSNTFKKEVGLHRIQKDLTSNTFFQRNSHVFCLWKRSDIMVVGLAEHNGQSSQLQTQSPSSQPDKGLQLGAIPKIPSSKNTSNLNFQSPTNAAPPKFQSPTSAAVPLQFTSPKNATDLSPGPIQRTTNGSNVQIQWTATDIPTCTPVNKQQTVTIGVSDSAQNLVRITPPKLVPVYWNAPPRTDEVLPPTFGVPKPKIKNVYEADIPIARQAFPPNIGDFEYFFLIVAEVYSPGEFYWFLSENRKPIEDLTDDMTLFYSSNPEYVISRSEMYIGQLVAAMYTDNLWYRARIVGCYEDQFQVFYVDYGSKNFVKIERIRHLHVHFLQMPLQVFRGRMFGIQPLPHEPKWSFESGKRFLDLVKESKTIAAAKMIEETLAIPEYEIDTEYSLTLVDTTKEKDVHISDYLIENGFAVPYEKEQNVIAVTNPSYEYSTTSSTASPVTSPVKKTAAMPSPVPTCAFPSLDVNSVVNQLERTSVSSSSTSQTSRNENFDLVNPSMLSNGIPSCNYRTEESVIASGEEPSFVPQAESIKSNDSKCVNELVLKDQRKLYIIEDSGELYLSKPDMLLLIPSLDNQIAALKIKIDCKVVTEQTHPHIFVDCANVPWLKDNCVSQLTLYSLQYVSLLFFLCSVKDKVASLAIEAKRKEFSNK